MVDVSDLERTGTMDRKGVGQMTYRRGVLVGSTLSPAGLLALFKGYVLELATELALGPRLQVALSGQMLVVSVGSRESVSRGQGQLGASGVGTRRVFSPVKSFSDFAKKGVLLGRNTIHSGRAASWAKHPQKLATVAQGSLISPSLEVENRATRDPFGEFSGGAEVSECGPALQSTSTLVIGGGGEQGPRMLGNQLLRFGDDGAQVPRVHEHRDGIDSEHQRGMTGSSLRSIIFVHPGEDELSLIAGHHLMGHITKDHLHTRVECQYGTVR